MANAFNSAYNSYFKFVQDTTKVGFLQGTQASLNGLIASKTAKEGYFYLTSDSHRLYVGRKIADNQVIPVPVNEGITTVDKVSKDAGDADTVTALPSDPAQVNVGEFYYVTEGNILAVVGGTYTDGGIAKIRWIQMNKVATLVEGSSAVSVEATTITEGTGENAVTRHAAKVSTSVKDTNENEVSGDFTFVAGKDIDLTVNGKQITVSTSSNANTTYDLESSVAANGVASISLKGSDNSTDTITLSSDDITIAAIGTNGVKLTGTNYAIDSVTVAAAADNGNGFVTTVKDKSAESSSASGSFDPTITVKDKNKNAIDGVHFVNSTAALDVYSTDAVEALITEKLQVADAMTFGGTITAYDNTGGLPTTATKGETYKVASAFAFEDSMGNPIQAQVGDLFIANGTEGTDGKLTNIIWEYIPSGNDEIITALKELDSFSLTSSLFGEATGTDILKVTAEQGITITGKAATDLKIGHSNKITEVALTGTASSTATVEDGTQVEGSTTYTVPYLTALSTDANGHITAATQGMATIKDTHMSLKSATTSATASDNVVTVSEKVVTSDSGEDGVSLGSVKFSSDTLTLSGSTDKGVGTVGVDLTWGIF